MNQIDPMTAYEAPQFAELEAIAKRIGYGRACQILGDLWDQMLEREYGRPSTRGKMERRRDIEEIEAVIKSRATQPASAPDIPAIPGTAQQQAGAGPECDHCGDTGMFWGAECGACEPAASMTKEGES